MPACDDDVIAMTKILQTIKREFLQVLPPTIFFFFAFNIVAITDALTLRGHGIQVSSILGATILALIVAKVMLVGDHLPFMNKFPDKPLMYNMAWKTFIYVLAILLVRYVEELIPFLKKEGGFMEANQHLLREMVWPRFWAIQIWLVVLFFFYSALVEFVHALGKERVIKMFFGR